jgi:hypothetical protein
MEGLKGRVKGKPAALALCVTTNPVRLGQTLSLRLTVFHEIIKFIVTNGDDLSVALAPVDALSNEGRPSGQGRELASSPGLSSVLATRPLAEESVFMQM